MLRHSVDDGAGTGVSLRMIGTKETLGCLDPQGMQTLTQLECDNDMISR